MTAGEKEQIKLTANLLNALSSGTILVSIVAPYIGMGMGTVTTNSDLLNLTSLSGFGFLLGIVLHLLARRAVARLED